MILIMPRLSVIAAAGLRGKYLSDDLSRGNPESKRNRAFPLDISDVYRQILLAGMKESTKLDIKTLQRPKDI